VRGLGSCSSDGRCRVEQSPKPPDNSPAARPSTNICDRGDSLFRSQFKMAPRDGRLCGKTKAPAFWDHAGASNFNWERGKIARAL